MAGKLFQQNINNITFGNNRVKTVASTSGIEFSNTTLKISFSGTHCTFSPNVVMVRPGATITSNNNTLTITNNGIEIIVTATPETETDRNYYYFNEWGTFPQTVNTDINITASISSVPKYLIQFNCTDCEILYQQQTINSIYIVKDAVSRIEQIRYSKESRLCFDETLPTLDGSGTITRIKGVVADAIAQTDEYLYICHAGSWTNRPLSVVADTTITVAPYTYTKGTATAIWSGDPTTDGFNGMYSDFSYTRTYTSPHTFKTILNASQYIQTTFYQNAQSCVANALVNLLNDYPYGGESFFYSAINNKTGWYKPEDWTRNGTNYYPHTTFYPNSCITFVGNNFTVSASYGYYSFLIQHYDTATNTIYLLKDIATMTVNDNQISITEQFPSNYSSPRTDTCTLTFTGTAGHTVTGFSAVPNTVTGDVTITVLTT